MAATEGVIDTTTPAIETEIDGMILLKEIEREEVIDVMILVGLSGMTQETEIGIGGPMREIGDPTIGIDAEMIHPENSYHLVLRGMGDLDLQIHHRFLQSNHVVRPLRPRRPLPAHRHRRLSSTMPRGQLDQTM